MERCAFLFLADHRTGRGEGGLLAKDDSGLFMGNVSLDESLQDQRIKKDDLCTLPSDTDGWDT